MCSVRLQKQNCTGQHRDKESTHCQQDRRVTIIVSHTISAHLYKNKESQTATQTYKISKV